MIHGRVGGIHKTVSRLIMGCAFLPDLEQASRVYDHYLEHGGNAFDTARIYGQADRLLGQWLRNRAVRDDVVVIAKGAHTPNCDPASIGRQLGESLDELGIDGADLYVMHHDNEEVPVEEFVDALDAEVRAGRTRACGVSNWSIDRFAAANAYAAEAGRHPLRLLSNHFGLARVAELPWPGGRHATDERSRTFLRTTQTSLFAWSAQSRGFFARADPADLSDEHLVRCYYTDDNFERLHRTRRLADELGVEPTAIALAYVLHQPFPTFALIGPLTPEETLTSLRALDIELSPDQIAWLNLDPTESISID